MSLNTKLKLGLDCSSSCTGYCIRDNEVIYKYGEIKYKHSDFKVRCVEIVKQIKKLCKENSVNFVVFEDIQSGRFSHASYVLSFLQGALVYMLEEEKISYCPITISTWRRDVGIKSKQRKEQKQEAINLVKSKYNIEQGEDVCEAILLSEFNNFI